jgi:hypothetical protein
MLAACAQPAALTCTHERQYHRCHKPCPVFTSLAEEQHWAASFSTLCRSTQRKACFERLSQLIMFAALQESAVALVGR